MCREVGSIRNTQLQLEFHAANVLLTSFPVQPPFFFADTRLSNKTNGCSLPLALNKLPGSLLIIRKLSGGARGLYVEPSIATIVLNRIVVTINKLQQLFHGEAGRGRTTKEETQTSYFIKKVHDSLWIGACVLNTGLSVEIFPNMNPH